MFILISVVIVWLLVMATGFFMWFIKVISYPQLPKNCAELQQYYEIINKR